MNQILIFCTTAPTIWSLSLWTYFLFFTVPGVWHAAAVRQQALHYKSRGIYFCHAEHLPGHHLPVQLPAADHGRRPWIKAPLFPKHISAYYLNSYQQSTIINLEKTDYRRPVFFFFRCITTSFPFCAKKELTHPNPFFLLYIWSCDPGYTVLSPAWSCTVVVQHMLEIPVSLCLCCSEVRVQRALHPTVCSNSHKHNRQSSAWQSSLVALLCALPIEPKGKSALSSLSRVNFALNPVTWAVQ